MEYNTAASLKFEIIPIYSEKIAIFKCIKVKIQE